MTDAHIPSDLYVVRIYKHDGSLFYVLRNWIRMEFSQRINSPWNHSIFLKVSPTDELGEILRTLKRDYFFLITRYDPVTNSEDLVYEGFHHTSQEQTQLDGNISFTLYGGGYTKLLDRRVIIPPSGEEYNAKNGAAETVIKEYVYECMVNPIGIANSSSVETQQTTNFIDKNRIMPNFSVEHSEGRGEQVEYNARFTILDSVVKSLAEAGKLDYGVVGSNPPGNFVFKCQPIWGVDRRLDNTEGNAEAVFSLERGNMIIPLLATNHRHEQNFAYVGGQGQGDRRLIAQLGNYDAINESPWGRSEFFISAQKAETYTQLLAEGSSELEARKATESFIFDFKMTESSRWIRDWGLGDYVTALYRGRQFDKQISEITVRVSTEAQQYEQILLEFEDIRYGY